jgi:NAD-dependent dihydropyrimidine dehydrogenase PreA subunit
MAFVITHPCIGSKEAACVDVCPVDCIHPAPGERWFEQVEHLYINPGECIDCGACLPACPSNAIYHESSVPRQWQQYIKDNAGFYRRR